MNELKKVKDYLSIKNLNATELPNFVVITGENGSGKSHLLQAIDNGRIQFGDTLSNNVVLHTSLAPQKTESSDYQMIKTQLTRELVNIKVDIAKHPKVIKLLERLDGYGLSVEDHFPEGKLLTQKEFVKLNKGLEVEYENYVREIEDVVKLIIQIMLKKINNLNDVLVKLKINKPIIFLEKNLNKLFEAILEDYGSTDILNHNLVKLFTVYKEKCLRKAQEIGLDICPNRLPNEDKWERFYKDNPKPWEVINELLQKKGLSFELNEQNLESNTPVEVYLYKKGNKKDIIQFEDLSSGERIFFSLVMCIFNVDGNSQEIKKPDILLFDEVDAPLHPTIAKSFIEIIKEYLVDRSEIKVLLATHSPSTVAISPDESIFEMKNNPREAQLEKCTKQYAVNMLTAGIPTLSIDFENNKQVFVESDRDEKIYSKLFMKARNNIQTDGSLIFISSGNGRNEASGHGQVRKFIRSLSHNKQVAGLIDWDKEHRPDMKINLHILCNGKRKGLENLILDPVFILIALVDKDPKQTEGRFKLVPEGTEKSSIHGWSEAEWQLVLDYFYEFLITKWDEFFKKLEGDLHTKAKIIKLDPDSEKVTNTYNNMSLSISNDILTMHDHVYERFMFNIFGEMLGVKDDAKLVDYIVDKVILEYSSFIPSDLIETFENILKN